MQILIYNWKDINNPFVGGAEIITFEYAKRLANEGHDVTWFCRQFSNGKDEEKIDGVKVVRSGTPFTTYYKGYQYYKNLKTKPDLVIDMLNTIAWQTPLYARKKSKVVQYINQLAKEVWNYEMNPPLSWIGRILEPLQLIPYHNTPVVTYAKSTANDLVNWGYKANKIFQFRLGLDHSRYQPGIKSKYPLIIQVCRMVKMKRPDLTVRAFSEVVKKHPTAKLALVGSGPFKEEVTALVHQLELDNSVLMPDKDILFFKNVKGDQKITLMQEAWYQVHPSVKEGWGMVITEAAACGTPTIATAVTGQVDAIINGETGILIDPNPSINQLSRAMLKLIENQSLRDKLSKNCINFAADFTWEKSYEQFKAAISQATGLKL